MRIKVKDALTAVEEARNKEQQQREMCPCSREEGKGMEKNNLKCQREHTRNASAPNLPLLWQKIGRET